MVVPCSGGAMQPTGTIVPSWLWIFDRNIPNHTYTTLKSPKRLQSQRNFDIMNTTEHHMYRYSTSLLFPSCVTRSQQVSPQRREEAIVDCHHNRGCLIGGGGGGGVADLGLSAELWSSLWRVKTRQTPRLLITCYQTILPFFVLFWRRAPRTAKIHRFGEDTELRADMHSRPELHRSKTFFSKLEKKINKTYLHDAQVKKKAFVWVSRSDIQGLQRSKAKKKDDSG